MLVKIAAHGYSATIDPTHGATVLSAHWQKPNGEQLPLLAPLAHPENGLRAGCFVMAPFANRINAGQFHFAGRAFQTPITNPQENMASHGFVRTAQWQVLHADDTSARFSLDASALSAVWSMTITQDVIATENGLKITLSVKNTGDDTMPFGMGLHPWFPVEAGSTLTFAASGAHVRDARGLPIAQIEPRPEFAQDTAVAVDQMDRFDRPFSGWAPRIARLTLPSSGGAIEILADGALKHLHVFVPADRPVICAEPVSHLPDALNRPDLGPDAQMYPLESNAVLSGSMTLRGHSYP